MIHNGRARFQNFSTRLEEEAENSQARNFAKLLTIDFCSTPKSFESALTRRGTTVLKISLVDWYKNIPAPCQWVVGHTLCQEQHGGDTLPLVIVRSGANRAARETHAYFSFKYIVIFKMFAKTLPLNTLAVGALVRTQIPEVWLYFYTSLEMSWKSICPFLDSCETQMTPPLCREEKRVMDSGSFWEGGSTR